MNEKIKVKKKHLYIFLAFLFVFLLLLAYKSANNYLLQEKSIRPSAIAGTWYPGNAEDLKETVGQYLNNVKQLDFEGKIKALIVPHAGYRFSGQTAATAYKQLKDEYSMAIIIGPSHTESFSGASIPDVTHYETPLGLVMLSKKAKELVKKKNFLSHPTAHIKEHDIEIQLPFLQEILADFEIIPILIGASTSEDELKSIAESIKAITDENTLIIISSDFTHYGPNYGYTPFNENIEENLKSLDYAAIESILAKDPEAFKEFIGGTQCTICGRKPIEILLYMLEDKDNIKPNLIYYTTSGAITGDFTNSVSYVTIAFTEPVSEALTKDEQQILLNLARSTLETYLRTGKMPVTDNMELTPALEKVQGCFTTLNKDHGLRGCIGHILPQEELYKCVMDNAVNAAINDRRFNPVAVDELKDIKIEISALTVPQKLEFSSGDDLLSKLRPMVDGVVLRQGWKQSTYLPQVWANFNSKEEFLPSLCEKGGMPADCWKDTSTEVFTYQAFVFEESSD